MAKEWEKNLTIWSHWVVYYVTFRFWLNAVPMSLSKSLAFHFLTQSSRSKQESIINAKRHILRSVNSRRYCLANCLAIVRATCVTYLSLFVFDDFLFVCSMKDFLVCLLLLIWTSFWSLYCSMSLSSAWRSTIGSSNSIAEVQMPLKLNVFCQVFDCSKHSACD